MNLHEFRLLCTDARLTNETFPLREIDMCFRQSMMTEIDEILDGEHLEMIYVEFIEAISRVADQIYRTSAQYKTLDKKIVAIMPSLLKVAPASALANFEQPTEEHFYNMKYVKKIVTIQEYIESK